MLATSGTLCEARAVAATRTARTTPRTRPPTFTLERRLLRDGHPCVIGIDEVGRGAWAGPVVVGAVCVTEPTRPPRGVRDSKLLAPQAREELDAAVRAWCAGAALGSASPTEIDEVGMTVALHRAAARALQALGRQSGVALLDGNFDYLGYVDDVDPPAPRPETRLLIGGDRTTAVIACASIIAKVARDAEMRELAVRDDRFGFAEHKGYGTPEHASAVRRHGLSEHHRRSWQIAAAAPLEPEAPEDPAGSRTEVLARPQ